MVAGPHPNPAKAAATSAVTRRRQRWPSKLADCDRKLARYRAALEAGADPKVVTGWIAEVEAERRRILATLARPASGRASVLRLEFGELV